MQSPLAGSRVSWMQRGYILLLFTNKNLFSSQHESQFLYWIYVFAIAFPLCVLVPYFFYNKRLQQQTLSCISWCIIYTLIGSNLLFTPNSYWFSIYYAHACQYVSQHIAKYPFSIPFPRTHQTILSILSWKTPFVVANLSGAESMHISGMLVASLFIPEGMEVICEFICSLIEALGVMYEKWWQG